MGVAKLLRRQDFRAQFVDIGDCFLAGVKAGGSPFAAAGDDVGAVLCCVLAGVADLGYGGGRCCVHVVARFCVLV